MALGSVSLAAGLGSLAVGYFAEANGEFSTALGRRASAFGASALALGTQASATGDSALALGPGAVAGFARSAAIGAGAISTRSNQLTLGDAGTEVTITNLAGSGETILQAGSDGNLSRSGISGSELSRAIRRTIPGMEKAIQDLGTAVQSSMAVSAALSAVPEVSLQEDEPVRCGFGTGGAGQQYAVAAGCAVRVVDRVHLNGALSYSPSVDYGYASTPSVVGRLGFSFPLGRAAKARPTSQASAREVGLEIALVRQEVKTRDAQIGQLRQQIRTLQARQGGSVAPAADPGLVASLRRRIEELESEKAKQQEEDRLQNSRIRHLQDQLAVQQARFEQMMQQVSHLLPSNTLPSTRLTSTRLTSTHVSSAPKP